MKLLIAGSRNYLDKDRVWDEINLHAISTEITEIVSGCAKGPDTFGAQWGFSYGIPVKEFPADWNKYGRSAGYIRNKEMAEYADELIAFWDGRSNGTKNMIDLMRIAKKKTTIIYDRSEQEAQ